MCNGRHRYNIHDSPGEMPNWLSYRGEGCSLSFHIPPVFHGLVLWFKKTFLLIEDHISIIIIIRNKSNERTLFVDKQPQTDIFVMGGIRYISRSEMSMEDYCAGNELKIRLLF